MKWLLKTVFIIAVVFILIVLLLNSIEITGTIGPAESGR